jgi:hypothetical protein
MSKGVIWCEDGNKMLSKSYVGRCTPALAGLMAGYFRSWWSSWRSFVRGAGAAKTGQAVVELGRGWEEWLPAVCAAGAAAGLEASRARRPAGERGGCGSCWWARPARAWELSGAGWLGAVRGRAGLALRQGVRGGRAGARWAVSSCCGQGAAQGGDGARGLAARAGAVGGGGGRCGASRELEQGGASWAACSAGGTRAGAR